MNLTETSAMRMLERYLDMVTYRGAIVAANVANIDTPGYRTRDIDFRSALARVLNHDRTTMPEPVLVAGLVQRPDGNNVSLERESMLLAQTQLEFRTGVQLLKTEFRRMLTAINEGK
jgi:flagellar basal-body rod protein FlgB